MAPARQAPPLAGAAVFCRSSGICGSRTLSAIGAVGSAQNRARGAAPTWGERCFVGAGPCPRLRRLGFAQNRARGAAPTLGGAVFCRSRTLSAIGRLGSAQNRARGAAPTLGGAVFVGAGPCPRFGGWGLHRIAHGVLLPHGVWLPHGGRNDKGALGLLCGGCSA
jgi:hypothetical protein